MAGTFAQFRTPLGDIIVELFAQDKPVTVANFENYITSGRYTDMFAHRWEPGFVIQGGGYYVTNRFSTNTSINLVSTFGTITNEYSVGKTYSNTYGTLAMARLGGATNSATSQWFFNLADNSFLDAVDGGFTVFGRVVSGTNLLNRFNNTTTTNNIYRPDICNPADSCALNHLPIIGTNVVYSALMYFDITLLNVQVQKTNGGARTISWNSVSNRVQQVEYTTNFPPTWQMLAATNGNGSRISVTDTNQQSARRFYRVRLDYP